MSLSGHSHSFDTGIARELGLNCAIVYNHIIYWLKTNAAKEQGIIDGKVWMFETQQQIAAFLDYLTIDIVKKSIIELVEKGYLIKGNFNKNPFDRTSWYTIPDQSIFQKNFTKVPIGTMGNADSHFPNGKTAPCIYDKKNKEIKENDDDDRVREDEKKRKEIDSLDIEKINTQGQTIKATQSQIFKHFIGKPYSTETIKEAIERSRLAPNPINNILKYIESTCQSIDAQNASKSVYPKSKPKLEEKTERVIVPRQKSSIPFDEQIRIAKEKLKNQGK